MNKTTEFSSDSDSDSNTDHTSEINFYQDIEDLDSSSEVDNFSEFTPNLTPFNLVNKIPTTSWGNLTGEKLYRDINKAYDTIVHWQENLFMLPSGKQGKEFIKELSSWLNKFNNDSVYQSIALKAYMILPSLLLQKPSKKSKAKEHSLKLSQRLILWREGNIMTLLREGKAIQKHLQKQSRQYLLD